MPTFDLNFYVQLDPKGTKVHFGFHVQAATEEDARTVLHDQLAGIVKQLASAPAPVKTAKAPKPAKTAKPAAAKKTAKAPEAGGN